LRRSVQIKQKITPFPLQYPVITSLTTFQFVLLFRSINRTQNLWENMSPHVGKKNNKDWNWF
jgi:hypothetical protein